MINKIKWSILINSLLINKNHFNYIYKKLKYLIDKENLSQNIEILYKFNDNDDLNDNKKILLNKSKGKFISYIDDFDDISDNFIKEIYKNLENENFIIGNFKIGKYITENNLSYYKIPIKKKLIDNNYINGSFNLNPIKKIDNVFIFEKEKIEYFSIIISAYKSEYFIEECLNSIENQTYFKNNNNYEILIGVDGCINTYNKLIDISHKYRNLKIFMMEDNKGTYITLNTLLELVNYDNIIKFDSDDIMMENLVEEVFKNKKNYDILKIGSIDNINRLNKIPSLLDGVIFFKKNIINIFGGYQPWRCAADSELLIRLKDTSKIGNINKALFIRRIHNNSLTNNKDTGYHSILRNKYKKLINKHENIKINRIVNNIVNIGKNISIILTAYETENYIEECLDSIENQTYFKNNNNYEILIGIDNCHKTLEKIKNIKHRYRNLRIFMMEENKGTYITSNTLLDLVKYNYIIRFDSDDIMYSNMIEKIIPYIDKYDIIRFGYDSFTDLNDIKRNKLHYPHGVILFKKEIFKILGGYQPWLCAADTELIIRYNNPNRIYEINERLFLRREHDNSLTKNKNTEFNSKLRNDYKKLIGNHKNIWIDKKINKYKEI